MHMTLSPDGKYEQIQTLKFIFSLLLSCQNIFSSPIPTPLLYILQ